MNRTQAAHLSLEEASAALCAMAAGRRSIPPLAELRAMLAERTRTLPPATAKLFAEIDRAATQAKRSADPIARSAAELVLAVVAIARQQIEEQAR